VDPGSLEKILSLTFSDEDRRILFRQEEFRKAAAETETDDDIVKVIELGAKIIRRLAKDNRL
jgi:hypothetical protein